MRFLIRLGKKKDALGGAKGNELRWSSFYHQTAPEQPNELLAKVSCKTICSPKMKLLICRNVISQSNK